MVQKQSFGDYIKGLRTDKHIGVRELGRAVDVTGMHISNIEKIRKIKQKLITRKLLMNQLNLVLMILSYVL